MNKEHLTEGTRDFHAHRNNCWYGCSVSVCLANEKRNEVVRINVLKTKTINFCQLRLPSHVCGLQSYTFHVKVEESAPQMVSSICAACGTLFHALPVY